MKTPVLFTLALLCAGAAHSQTVWRCGADGRVYSDSPCPAEGRLVAATDARSGEQRQAAREVLQRDRALAHELTAQRHEREREWRAGAGAAGIVASPNAEPGLKPKPVKTKAKAKKHRPEADGTWRAIAQVSR
jgi:hypothetical protein